MKKGEATEALHQLFPMWAEETNQLCEPSAHLSFIAFKNWLTQKHYSHYLDFRSGADADDDAEIWFDRYFKQAWRN